MDSNATHSAQRETGGRYGGRHSLTSDSPLNYPAPTDAERRERDRADATGIPYLMLRDALRLQRIVPLQGGRIIVGRAEETGLPIPWDPGISRMHLALEQDEDGTWCIVDGSSLNGTYVNQTRVRDRCRLADGDLVQLGDTTIAFRKPVVAFPTQS